MTTFVPHVLVQVVNARPAHRIRSGYFRVMSTPVIALKGISTTNWQIVCNATLYALHASIVLLFVRFVLKGRIESFKTTYVLAKWDITRMEIFCVMFVT